DYFRGLGGTTDNQRQQLRELSSALGFFTVSKQPPATARSSDARHPCRDRVPAQSARSTNWDPSDTDTRYTCAMADDGARRSYHTFLRDLPNFYFPGPLPLWYSIADF